MSDLDHIMAVMAAAFDPLWREAWTRRQVEDSLCLPHTHAIVLDQDGRDCDEDGLAAGFVLARRAPGEEELLLVAVRREFRSCGLGQLLMERFIQSARENGAESVFLEMREGNSADALYRALGFEPIGRRKGYYTTLEGIKLDAITFGLSL